MVDRTKNRSDSYQHFIQEALTAPDRLSEVAESQSIYSQLNPFGYNEERHELKEQLRLAFWRIVDTQLTERQKQVIHLYAKGLTQIEIAKQLDVNQSSITKSINGNCDYRNGKKIYGGAKKKLKRIADKDPEIQEILKRMEEIQSD